MNKPDLKEQVSALMDGEVDRESVRFLLRSVDADADLRRSWSNYQIGRACLRRQHDVVVGEDFAAGIMARLQDEPAVRGRMGVAPWLRYASGGAIAAAVAVGALLVSHPVQNLDTAAAMVATPARAPVMTDTFMQPQPSIVAQPASATFGSDAYSPNVGLDPRLQSYLLRHYEATGGNGRVGMAPYVLLVVPPRETLPAGTVRPAPAQNPQ
ncbi:MAG: sigma-E factor negative regulatory protein [Tahibacter sp.]